MYMLLKNSCAITSFDILICAYKFSLVQSLKQTNENNVNNHKRIQEQNDGHL